VIILYSVAESVVNTSSLGIDNGQWIIFQYQEVAETVIVEIVDSYRKVPLTAICAHRPQTRTSFDARIDDDWKLLYDFAGSPRF
jgi:hypothetical protein